MKRTLNACDRAGLTTRIVTEDGYLIAQSTLARTGVQEYRAFELGLESDGMDPMKVIRLHRPAEEVFNPASMASFESKPITIEHPKEAVTADNWSELAKGEVRDVTRSGDLMTGTLLIKSRDAIDALQQEGKVQLSNGYTFELDMTPGQTADGRTYDGIQRNIRGNHVALVESARCGSVCRLGDASDSGTGRTSLVGRDAFVGWQRTEWERSSALADDGGNRSEQTVVDAAALARMKPIIGRAAFMQRQAAAWQQGGDK